MLSIPTWLASRSAIVITPLVLSWMLTGCSDNGDAGSEAPEPLASAETVQLDKAQVGKTPTRNPGSLLWQKVDAGEWTLEEGLIANLKIMAGEKAISSVYGDTPVSFRRAEVLIRTAETYARDSENTEARQEIQRLLDRILIDKEQLKQEAAPAPEPLGLLEPNQLFRRLASLVPAARADTDCSNLWKGEWDARHPDTGACAHTVEFNAGGRLHRIFYPAEWDVTDHEYREYIALTRDAVRHTMSIYQEWGRLRRMDIVLGFSEEESVDFAGKAGIDADDERFCDMTLSTPNDDHDDYAFLIAHETFHCFQGWNLGDAYWGPGAGPRWIAASAWWTEGTAEYFADVAYPDADTELQHWDEFNSLSSSKSILQLSYENVFFFQYLAHQVGNAQIIAWLKRLPGRGGFDAQSSALAGWGDMQTILQEFGRAYLDMQLKDAGGGLIFLEPERGPLTTMDTPGFGVPARPFVLHRERVEFAEGKGFELDATPAEPPPGRYSVKPRPDGEWRPFPSRIPSPCGAADNYQLLATTATSDSGSYQLDVELKDVGGEDSEPAQVDSCLTGKWRGTPESFEESLASMVADVPTFRDVEVKSYDATICYDDAGYFESRVSAHTEWHMMGAGRHAQNMKMLNNIQASANGRYSVEGGEIVLIDHKHDVTHDTRMWIDGEPVYESGPVNLAAMAGFSGPEAMPTDPGPYHCSGDRLESTPPVPGMHPAPIVYERVTP